MTSNETAVQTASVDDQYKMTKADLIKTSLNVGSLGIETVLDVLQADEHRLLLDDGQDAQEDLPR